MKLKIELDDLRFAMDLAFADGISMTEIRKIYAIIKEKESDLKNLLPADN